MGDFTLDLTGCDIFLDESLVIDKSVSFIFGKNGTGKTTLAYLFQEQSEDYDFRCFQGFDGIVGEDRKLNAVILGEENNEIDKEIKILEKEISDKEKLISDIEKEVLPSEDNTNNLWEKVDERKKAYTYQESKISAFFTQSASKIKKLNNPQVASTTYNKNHFKNEISKAKLLTEAEIEKHKSQINTDIKIAVSVDCQAIDLQSLLIETNSLLSKEVVEKEVISEFSGDSDKTKFAEEGFRLHDVNDKCAFCGGIVGKEIYKKLERYFAADDIQQFRDELNGHIALLDDKIKVIKDVVLNVSEFYPEYIDEVSKINIDFKEKQSDILAFLSSLREKTDDKLKELFEKSDVLKLQVPESFENEINQYNKVVVENNESDLSNRKENSKNGLRFNEIKKLLDDFKYNEENLKLEQLKVDYTTQKEGLDKENEKIDELKIDIEKLRSKIVDLQAKTKNEKILAEEINHKLRLYVNFDLEYLAEVGGEGHYQVKCKNTGEYRDITQLSTGEKNIIAFLYFTQKLNEVDNPKSGLERIIVFDDPMTSNDDTMQYLIIEELNKLISQLDNMQDKIIIMTHNNHFYLNVKYNYKSYKKNIFLRLLSDGKYTTILRLSKSEEDFKTNYEALWHELGFLYVNGPSKTMLLNPIRRIVETYTKFNSIDKHDMLDHVSGAAKLFNVNSHSIDDLEADLNGRSKKDIMKMMRECFSKENAINHFNQYWTIDLDSTDS